MGTCVNDWLGGYLCGDRMFTCVNDWLGGYLCGDRVFTCVNDWLGGYLCGMGSVTDLAMSSEFLFVLSVRKHLLYTSVRSYYI